MSRILFLVNHDVVIYNFRLELVERLLEDGHQVIISSPNGERIGDLIKLGCEYHEIQIARHGMNPLKEIKLIFTYKKLLDSVKPDIVFSYTIKPNIYGAIACRSKKIPCVANITGLGTAVENGGIIQKITILLYKYAFTKVKRVFFQNAENMRFFTDYKIALGKHELLPGSGVSLERFSPIEYPCTDKIKFAFISRIMREKGIEQYLKAAKYIKLKYPEVEFHICGFCEQDYEERLKELSDEGIIIYHGMLRDIKPVLQDIQCIILPSYHEGMSNVLLESAACGRPVLASNVPGCRETFDEGVSGIGFEPKNTDSLCEAIEKFIALPYDAKAEMGRAGRRKMEREFDRNIVIRKYMDVIKDIEGIK